MTVWKSGRQAFLAAGEKTKGSETRQQQRQCCRDRHCGNAGEGFYAEALIATLTQTTRSGKDQPVNCGDAE